LYGWLERLEALLSAAGRKRVAVPTVLTTAPDVAAAFRADAAAAARLEATGATLSSICPLMYMNNPLCGKKPVITNSNKLRTYTKARYYTDADILAMVTGGRA
ncbi:MAG TPA: aconitase X, partial [Spirochaetales bacterium]|nr:aconitase X [Spirochaetales bacterium]